MAGKRIWLILVLVLWAVSGCGIYTETDKRVKCPKCSAVFTIEEGLRGFGP
jgi:hypothetical protein